MPDYSKMTDAQLKALAAREQDQAATDYESMSDQQLQELAKIEQQAKDAGAIGALARTTVDSLLFDFWDELKGKTKAAKDVGEPLAGVLPVSVLQTFGTMTPDQVAEYEQLYKKYRDFERVASEAAARAYPWAAAAGTIAGVLPQLLIPAGVLGYGVRGAKGLAAVAAGEGLVGAAYGAGRAKELKDVPGQAAEEAAIGAGFGVGLAGAGRAVQVFRRVAGKKLAQVAGDTIRESGTRVQQLIEQKLTGHGADAVRLRREDRLLRRLLTAPEVKPPKLGRGRAAAAGVWDSIAREKLDSINAAQRNRYLAKVGLTLSSFGRARESTQRQVLAEVFRDWAQAERASFAHFLSSRRGFKSAKSYTSVKGLKSAQKAEKELQKWLARTSKAEVRETVTGFLNSRHAWRLQRQGLVHKFSDPKNRRWWRRAADYVVDARYALNRLDRIHGEEILPVLENDVIRPMNRQSLYLAAAFEDVKKPMAQVKKLGATEREELWRSMVIAEKMPEGPLAEVAQALKAHTDKFYQIMVDQGLKVKYKDVYLPRLPLDEVEYTRAVRNYVRDMGLRPGQVLSEAEFGRVVNEAPEKLEQLAHAVAPLDRGRVQMFTSGQVQLNALNRALAKVGSARDYAAAFRVDPFATFERTGQLPEFVLKKDIGQLLEAWHTSMSRAALLGPGLRKLKNKIKQLQLLGDSVGADYVRRLVSDIAGTRPDTFASSVRSGVIQAQLKLEQLAEEADSKTARLAYQAIAGLPQFMRWTSGQIYANLLGLKPRTVIRNLFQPYLLTAMEGAGASPGQVGWWQLLAFRAQARAAVASVKGMEIVVSPELARLRGYQVGERRVTRSLSEILQNYGFMADRQTLEAYNTLYTAVKSKLGRAADAQARAAMWAYVRSDMVNRIVTINMAEEVSRSAIAAVKKRAKGAALTKTEAMSVDFLKRVDPGWRRRLIRHLDQRDSTRFRHEMASYLLSKTQFNYSRAAMSEFGRSWGYAFSMFTKWPLSIIGDSIDKIARARQEGETVRGVSEVLVKYLSPLLAAATVDYAVVNDAVDDDRTKLLLGTQGLKAWVPASSVSSIITSSDMSAPPVVDTVVGGLAAAVTLDPGRFQRWFATTVKYWTPGVSWARLVVDDIPTVLEGDNPRALNSYILGVFDPAE